MSFDYGQWQDWGETRIKRRFGFRLVQYQQFCMEYCREDGRLIATVKDIRWKTNWRETLF